MANVQDIYDGIISPTGGIYNPGPDVVFSRPRPQDVSRVTPEGLNVYSRPTVRIDPMTGRPIQTSASDPSTRGSAIGPVAAALAARAQKPKQIAAGFKPGPVPYSPRLYPSSGLAFVPPTKPASATDAIIAALSAPKAQPGRGQPVAGFRDPITPTNWDLPGMDTGMNGVWGPPTPNQTIGGVGVAGAGKAAPGQGNVARTGGLLGLLGQGRSQPTPYQLSPAGRDPAVHAALMQQAHDANTPAGGFPTGIRASGTRDAFGNDNAFNPPSVQRSTRWQTGY